MSTDHNHLHHITSLVAVALGLLMLISGFAPVSKKPDADRDSRSWVCIDLPSPDQPKTPLLRFSRHRESERPAVLVIQSVLVVLLPLSALICSVIS